MPLIFAQVGKHVFAATALAAFYDGVAITLLDYTWVEPADALFRHASRARTAIVAGLF